MRELTVRTKSGLEASCLVTQTGVHVFYELGHISFDKTYDNSITAALDIKNIIYDAELEEKTLFDTLKKELLAFNLEVECYE